MDSVEWADIRLVGSVVPSGVSAAQPRKVQTLRSLQGQNEAAIEILSSKILDNGAALICRTGRPARFPVRRHWLGSALPRMRL